jgi:hypothetical protein
MSQSAGSQGVHHVKTQSTIIGPVETRIAKAIAEESLKRHEHPGMTMRRWDYGLKHMAMRELVVELRRQILSPPPSPARQRAMNKQLAKNGQ